MSSEVARSEFQSTGQVVRPLGPESEAVARIVAGWPPLTARQQDVIQRVFAGRMEPARKSA